MTHMYPPQVLKHGECPDLSPGTVPKVPPISPRHENSFTCFFSSQTHTTAPQVSSITS
uniref:Uncharacterized protein n=1 Tax=Arundo donax TaxID=35708 RepID=A0A0A9DJA8_ARUDO